MEVITMRQEEKHPCEGTERVVSAMECTGAVPAFHEDEGDESERQLCAVQPAKRRNR